MRAPLWLHLAQSQRLTLGNKTRSKARTYSNCYVAKGKFLPLVQSVYFSAKKKANLYIALAATRRSLNYLLVHLFYTLNNSSIKMSR